MFKKTITLLLIITLIFSFVTVFSSAEKDTYLENIASVIDSTDNAELMIEVFSPNSYTATPCTDLELNERIKEKIFLIFEDMYLDYNKYLKTTDKEIDMKSDVEYYIDFSFDNTSYFTLRDNYFVTPWCNATVENPEEIVEKFSEYVNEQILPSLYGYDVPSKQIRKTFSGGTPSEKLLFSIYVDEALRGTPVLNAGEYNSKVSCTVEHIMAQQEIYILTLEGNRGRTQYYAELLPVPDRGSTYERVLRFDTLHIYDGKNLTEYEDAHGAFDIIVSGMSDDFNISEASICFENKYAKQTTDFINGYDLEYTFLGSDPKNNNRNMIMLFNQKQQYTEKAINYLKESGIMKGYPDGTFKGERPVTRAELTTIICRCYGLDTSHTLKKSIFTDVPISHWANGYINAMSGMNAVSGYEDGTFKPENNVLLSEAVKMIVALLHYDENLTYPDGYMNKATQLGILKNISVNTLSSASREEIAVMIYNALKINIKDN